MRWLITVRKSADLQRLRSALHECGGSEEENHPPVPLGESELVLQASGPADLPEKLKVVADVIDIFPNSDMELY